MKLLLLSCFLLVAFAAAPLWAQQTTPGAQPPTSPANPSANQAAPPGMLVGPVHENVVYGVANGETLLLDVFEPANNTGLPRPGILLIHGGAWNSFDKSTMRPLAHFLALAGFVAIPVDYRLFNNDINHWPAQLDDVQMAVRWVRANSEKYNIDRNHIGAYGHSAGGQLALLLGMTDTRDNSDPALAKYSSKVQAVVDAAGPTDFTTQTDKDGIEYMTSFLNADYAKHPEVWRDASPISHVAKSNAPILIIHGTKDEMVPVAAADALDEALKKAGATVQFLRLDSDHDFSDPASHRKLALETQSFFFHYLASSSAP
ncbi:MAG: alpha/beta hydrolase [Candidatus Acidiferrales bacterium]